MVYVDSGACGLVVDSSAHFYAVVYPVDNEGPIDVDLGSCAMALRVGGWKLL